MMFRQLENSEAKTLTITVNNQALEVLEGTTVAAAVLASGLRQTRTTPVSNSSRAPYCLMGVCFDCLMVIDGLSNQRACCTYVKQGMRVETQEGAGLPVGGNEC